MLRLLEIVLFLAPFVAFAAWRLLAPASGPSVWVLIAAAGALILLAGGLIWFSREAALPPGAGYVPAQLQNGQIVQGHGASK